MGRSRRILKFFVKFFVKMPRKKASAPQRLDEDERQNQNWNMGEGGSGNQEEVIDLINDDFENYDSDEDADFIPDESRPKRQAKGSKSKKKTKKTTETDEIDENLSFLLEASDFCVAISKSKPEFSEWSRTILYSFHIELLGGVKIDLSASDFWIYLSHVPDINFVYIDNKHYQKIVNISKLNYQLLKAFEHGIHGIGMKRRNIILVPGEIQGKRMEIDIEVHESTLFKFNHPSDVVAKVPQSVKNSMEYFLQLDTNNILEQDIIDEETCNSEVEMLKQDIDKLYSIVKNYHETNEIPEVHIDPQHISLLPQLRPYQKLAVKWMIYREKYDDPELSKQLHPLYTEVTAQNGDVMYYNRKGGYLVKDLPKSMPMPKGGILADEMGLGKTVEVLSCMLCNPRTDIPKPEPLEVINISKESRKRRHRRTPSPTEFHLCENEDKDLDEIDGSFSGKKTVSFSEEPDTIMQVDGGESDYDSDESKSESETGGESDYDSNESKSEEPDTIMQVDGGESDYDSSESKSESDESKSESEPEEYVPKASQSRSGRQAAQRVIDNLVVDSSDEEDVPLSNKKVAKTKKGQNKTQKVQNKKSIKIQSSDSEEYIPSEE